MGTQQFCLRWNNHQTNLLAVFDQLLQNEAFVDVTLACEGLSIKAHKMVLSACSPYFQSLFLDNPCQHPIVILKDVRFSELKAVVDFMYKGEVNVSQDQLSALLKTAETLKVKGLAEVTGSSPSGGDVTRSALGIGPLNQSGTATASSDGRLSPPPKRKRGRPSKRPSTDGDLEVVESLVDVVPDGPDSVPTPQDRSVDANPSIKSELMGDGQQNVTDQSLNPSADMTFDGLPQEHTSNSRDSGTMLADQAQTSSSLGQQLPATASTSGMSPGQALIIDHSPPEIIPIKDEPYENDPGLVQSMVISTPTMSSMPTLPPQSSMTSTSGPPISATASIPAIPGTSSDSFSSEQKMIEYYCEVCRRYIPCITDISKHMELHKENICYCELCGRTYQHTSTLVRHLESHNPKRTSYRCNVCNAVLQRKDSLLVHMRTKHHIQDQLQPSDFLI